ncbi:hypothetical protein F4777DRAFT_590764 [Nemania sp. FL0916]|nr:hypothetical protein F4777DRAFT_590764 [Nemania sp. FL0916]
MPLRLPSPLPLESLELAILPKTTHNIAWSPDAELAFGCDDCVFVYVPDFTLQLPDGQSLYDGPYQYDEAALRFAVAPLGRPDLNRHLFDAVGQTFTGYNHFTGGGSGVITGHGSTLNHTIALAWSPCGLGRMDRSVLAVLTAAGVITVYCQGAPEAAGPPGRGARTIRPWVAVWRVGGGLLVPAIKGHIAPEKKECITSFAWSKGAHGKIAVLAYLNNEREVALLLVRASHDAKASRGHPGTWRVQEVARFMANGPHPTSTDPTDPYYADNNSSFALSWSPWLRKGKSQTSILSYVSHNYIGFRAVTLKDPRGSQQDPSVRINATDASGICLHLSTDAFVVWEDHVWTRPDSHICRGIIASPNKVHAFELPFDDQKSHLATHTTDECDTTYPSEEDILHTENPITGLVIHPPAFSPDASTPAYTLVRLSATHENADWYRTNLLQTPHLDRHGRITDNGLRWATEISQIIEHQLPRALAHRQGLMGEMDRGENGLDSGEEEFDSDPDSEFDFDLEDDSREGFLGIPGVDVEDQVHLNRVRIWGLAISPGGATSAVFISQHSTLEIERDTFAGLKCRVLFGKHTRAARDESAEWADRSLSTEAKAWEYMYGDSIPVPGFTSPWRLPSDDHLALRDQFQTIARRQLCIFCKLPLQSRGITSRCGNDHVFENCANTGVPVLAPNVSRTCGVCGKKSLKTDELLALAPQLQDIIEQDISAELCGGCGGKFTN